MIRPSLQVTFCKFLSAEQYPEGYGLFCFYASHTLGNHWKKHIIHSRYYSETLPKRSPNVNKMTQSFHCVNVSIRCIFLGRKNFFFKVAYSMTKFGDDMVNVIDLGLRRLVNSCLIVRDTIWVAPYYEFLESINTYSNTIIEPLRNCSRAGM